MRFLYVLDTVINIDKLDGFDTKFDNSSTSDLFSSLFEAENKKKLPDILSIRAIVGGHPYKLFDLKTSAFVPELEIEDELEYKVLVATIRGLATSIITDIINEIKQTTNEDVVYKLIYDYKDKFEELYACMSNVIRNKE